MGFLKNFKCLLLLSQSVLATLFFGFFSFLPTHLALSDVCLFLGAFFLDTLAHKLLAFGTFVIYLFARRDRRRSWISSSSVEGVNDFLKR